MSTPSKNDKLACMAARAKAANAPAPAAAAPRGDKFASMAARHQTDPASAPTTAAATIKPAPKQDKFASMAKSSAKPAAAQGVAPKRDKFAAMATSSAANESRPAAPQDGATKPEDRVKGLKKRSQQRQKVLSDLQGAEGLTWNLVQIASQTAKQLTSLKVDEEDSTLSDLSSKYRETLQKIHSLLSPHAKHIKAYQNHKEEDSDTTNMYVARVEMRLAQERRNVMEELLRLEKQVEPAPGDSSKVVEAGDKRKRDD